MPGCAEPSVLSRSHRTRHVLGRLSWMGGAAVRGDISRWCSARSRRPARWTCCSARPVPAIWHPRGGDGAACILIRAGPGKAAIVAAAVGGRAGRPGDGVAVLSGHRYIHLHG
jgi:hypothetical protein